MLGIRVSALSLLLLVGGAQAANLGFLRHSPIASFNETDWQALSDAVTRALNHLSAGEAQTWESSSGKARGSITVLGVRQRDGRECRLVRLENHYEQRKGTGTHTLCRVDGAWKVVE